MEARISYLKNQGMEFRYQEALTWFVPGFYLLFYLLVESFFLFPHIGDNDSSPGVWDIVIHLKDGAITFLVFAIPIVSLIVGWIINGFGGWAFRFVFKTPIFKTYAKLLQGKKLKVDNKRVKLTEYPDRKNYRRKYKDLKKYREDLKEFEKQAELAFDDMREKINLDNVDRFYYRYVFSRNMFMSQVFVIILSNVLFFMSSQKCWWSYFDTVIIATLCIDLIFCPVVFRDLSTHVKQVFLECKRSEASQK